MVRCRKITATKQQIGFIYNNPKVFDENFD